jgi:hypothetical protein
LGYSRDIISSSLVDTIVLGEPTALSVFRIVEESCDMGRRDSLMQNISSYVTERVERKTVEKVNRGEVKGRVGFFSYALMYCGLLLPAHTLATLPRYIFICSGH